MLQDGDDEYSLLVNLKRLYELQLTKSVPIESLYEDMAAFLRSFRNMNDEVCILILLVDLHFVYFVLTCAMAAYTHSGCQFSAA